MKTKHLFLSILLLTVFVSNQAMAFCRPFWNPEKLFVMEDVMKVFVHHSDNIESVIVQPAYKGTIKDFALVFATPNLPKVIDAPEGIFEDLETITNPIVWDRPMALETAMVVKTAAIQNTVTVHETVTAGDYIATTLSSTDSGDLKNWLIKNGYTVKQSDIDVFDYYINKKFYFVALKVDVSKVQVNTEGNIEGVLRPVQISFKADKAFLPMKLLSMPDAKDAEKAKLLVYTLSKNGLYIPGVNIQYANTIKKNDIGITERSKMAMPLIWPPLPIIGNSLERFSPTSKWLIRMDVQVQLNNINNDLYFQSGNIPGIVNQEKGAPRVFNKAQYIKDAGIIQGDAKELYSNTWSNVLQGNKVYRMGNKGESVKDIQKYFGVSATGYFGPMTKKAILDFQKKYGLKQDGVFGGEVREMLKGLGW